MGRKKGYNVLRPSGNLISAMQLALRDRVLALKYFSILMYFAVVS